MSVADSAEAYTCEYSIDGTGVNVYGTHHTRKRVWTPYTITRRIFTIEIEHTFILTYVYKTSVISIVTLNTPFSLSLSLIDNMVHYVSCTT